LSIAQGTNGAVVLGHRIADLDVVTIVDPIFVLCLVETTLPLTATVG